MQVDVTSQEAPLSIQKRGRPKGKGATSVVSIKRIPPVYVDELVGEASCPLDVQDEPSVDNKDHYQA
jgi:hypothetical protein